jgi:uncharacterized protein
LKLFVDTWGWIVLADPRDPVHREVTACYRRAARSHEIVTSNFVLDEAFTFLFSRAPYLQVYGFCSSILKSPEIRIEEVTQPRFRSAFELRKRFSDKPRISFTDLTSMALMSELQISEILTADAHFSHVGMGFRRLPGGTKR